ncbi:MAG TPA: PmoA family protein [Candidatus Hydrogenedentes bacterium]|nr:PmoA family protein [Candidatus Hydrogenedentota bacterium]HOL78159.1 PmoA family protein [Candidatus Hydrogenedentota bacterium]HPO87246.1 PmoA family protein [Candidatus Hydrogenedentota bacterium]
MKFYLSCILLCISLSVFAAQHDALDGKKITLKAGAHMSEQVPLVLPFEGEPPATRVQVLEPKTGNTFPATVRNGEFVFLSEGALPNTEHHYVVSLEKSDTPPRVVIEKQQDKDVLNVVIDDQLFTAYYYSKENKKPYLWPLNVQEDISITRNWPMGEKALTDDHPHQKSFWSAYGNVNGADCWMEGENSGYQIPQEVTYGSGDAYGWILSRNIWTNKAKEPVISETREYRFYATSPKTRIFDVTITFQADYGDALFKDTKEGGLVSVRMRDDLTEKFGKGVITNAEGKSGMAACWGKPSPWCDYSGPLEGVGVVGIALFDHPSNFRYPTCWHVRDYGLMGANCFGYAAFTAKDPEPKNGDYTLPAGQKLVFKYRVYVHTGDVTEARVADRYADFATPPEVSWAK